MFYTYTQSGTRKAIDLDGLYEGQSLFLLGGSPTLAEMDLSVLRRRGVVTMGMNNVPCVFTPHLWVCLDKPPCFSPHIYESPEIIKFTMISRRFEAVPTLDRQVYQCPSMFFFGTKEGFDAKNFLDVDRDICWWRSVFPAALQLAWRLGFRRVFLVGCGFHMPRQEGKQYAWKTTLSGDQVDYSQRTYSLDVDRLRLLKPTFELHGFQVVSCTSGSMAHGVIDYLPIEDAVSRVIGTKPPMADTTTLLHSSALRKQ